MVSTLSQAARPDTCSGTPKKCKAEGCLQWHGPQCNGCCRNAGTESEAIPKSRFLLSTEPVKNPEVVSAQTSLGEAVRSKETSTGTILQPHLHLLLRGGLGRSFPEPTDISASTMSCSKELQGWAGRQWKTHLHQEQALISCSPALVSEEAELRSVLLHPVPVLCPTFFQG